MPPLVDALLGNLQSLAHTPFGIFGHSMGALVGFELARAFRRAAGLQPAHLFVSGYGAPDLTLERMLDHRLPTTELVRGLHHLGGTPVEVLRNRELMDAFLPVIRADLAVCGTYEYQSEPPLTCPLTVLSGRDDPFVTSHQLAGWSRQTTGTFSLRTFRGGHFFVRESERAVLRTIQRMLDQSQALPAAA
jgi:medium-chain acyl-[acyl-carrier-protein] hydrolase